MGSPRNNQTRDKTVAYIVYALYAVGFLSGFFITLVGLIVAYIARSRTTDQLLQSHYSYQIQLFWWSFLIFASVIALFIIFLLAVPEIVIIVGLVLLLGALIWLIVLIVLLCKGIFRLMADEEAASLLPNRP